MRLNFVTMLCYIENTIVNEEKCVFVCKTNFNPATNALKRMHIFEVKVESDSLNERMWITQYKVF